jgi:hypothetical protein
MNMEIVRNTGSQWRRDFAERIAPIYAVNPHVDAVLLGGSTASGLADRYSDIEIGVFWNQAPTDDERQAAILQAGAGEHRMYPYDPAEEVWSDDLMLGESVLGDPSSGVLVELAHYTSEMTERTIRDVVERFNPDLLKQNLLAGIHNGIALHDKGLIQEWKSHLAVYPEQLAVAVVNHFAQIDHFWRWQMWLERGPNLMMLYNACVQVEQKIILSLLALNRVYYHGFKWLNELESSQAITPRDLRRRLNDVFELGPAEGCHILTELVEETYDLIDRHLPQVNVDRLRRVFRYQRPVLDAPPALEDD